jgi:nitrate reductase assembly molybdenum cofactor insertion protein NarJ
VTESKGLKGKEMKARKSRIAAAAEWRLLSLLFERPRPGWHEEVSALAAEVDDRVLQEAACAASAATEGEYLRWFGPGGAVSPRAVTYRPFEDPGQILADLTMQFDAFAFRPHREDPLDHIAVEVGFVGFLFLKEAYAVTRGDRDGARRVHAAREHFLDTHLAPLAAGVHQQLAALDRSYLWCGIEALAAWLGHRLAVPGPSPHRPPEFEACAGCPGPGASDAADVYDLRGPQSDNGPGWR